MLPGTVLLAAVAYIFYLASLGAITVVVKNAGTQTLTSVVVMTVGERYPLGDIEPDGSRRLRFDPVQDTGLTITSGAGETKIDTYITHGYVGKVFVTLENRKPLDFRDDSRVGL